MRKSFKKAVAYVAASALALTGVLTFKPETAKAGGEQPEQKTMHITIVGDLPECDGVAIQGWCGIDTANQVAISTLSSAWNNGNEENMTGVTVLDLSDNKADLSYTIGEVNEWIGMQLICYTSDTIDTRNANFADLDSSYAQTVTNDEIWVTFYMTGDVPYTISPLDPDAITVKDVEELIAAIGSLDDVTLDSESAIGEAMRAVDSYLAVSDEYSTDDISNYSDLTAAYEKLTTLQAEEREKQEQANQEAAGTLTLYVEKPESWDSVSLWAWTDSGDLFDAWPGEAMAECDNNDGWYKCTIKVDGITNIIFNNAGSPQTDNIEGLSAGTYWFWLCTQDTTENYMVEEMTTEAPQDWEDEEAKEIEVKEPEDPTEDPTDDPTDDPTEEPTSTAWDEAGLKVHVLMPEIEDWNDLGIYIFGTGENFGWSGGSGELTGAWPGAQMKLEKESEKWYAFGGTFSDGYYDVIINNFVSDAQANEGAVKKQAKEVELTDGEYWLLVDVDDEGKITAEVLTEAPADYDGAGLSEEDVVIEPADDPVDDPVDEPTNTDDPDPVRPAPTGDAVPYAAVAVIAMAAGVVVVSKKRRAA